MTVRVTANNSLRQNMLAGRIDLDDDTINVALILSTFQPHLSWPDWVGTTAYVFGDIVKATVPNGHAFEAQNDGTSGGVEPVWAGIPLTPGGGGTIVDGTVTWLDLGINPPLSETQDRGFVTPVSIWVGSTGFLVGDFIIPTSVNGHVYEAVVGGTTAVGEPVFPTDGSTVVDGTVTWLDIGMNPAGDETSGTGYTPGGETIASSIINFLNRRATWDGDDVVYSTATVTARWGQMYKVGTIDGWINPLVGLVLFNDTPSDVGSVDADFIIKWNTDGILRLF